MHGSNTFAETGLKGVKCIHPSLLHQLQYYAVKQSLVPGEPIKEQSSPQVFASEVHTDSLTGVCLSSAADSDGDSAEWPMEQDEGIDSLLCETPSLLPTLALSLPPGPQVPEGPTVAPAAAPASTAVSSHNQGKGIKVSTLP